MKRPGYVLIEVLCAAAIIVVMLALVIAKFGDGEKRLQQHQLKLSGQKFIMEARRVQQYNMYVKAENCLKIVCGINDNYYTIGNETEGFKKYSFADEGCGDIVFASAAVIDFSPLGSVNESNYIVLQHRDVADLRLTLNLQPVTGRLEIDK